MVDADRRFVSVAGGAADQVPRQMAFLDAHPDVTFGWSGAGVSVEWPTATGDVRRGTFIKLEHALDFLDAELGTDAPVTPLSSAPLSDTSKAMSDHGDDAEA